MTDVYPQKGYEMEQHDSQQRWSEPRSNNVVKAATAATTGGSFLVLSGLTFAGTVMALTVGSPLVVIFSPVLVPAVITMFLLPTGFLTSGGLGVVATTVLTRLYKYVTRGRPTRPDSLNQPTDDQKSTAWEMSQINETKIEGDHDTNKNVNYTSGAQGGRNEMVKAVTATAAGGGSLILSGLTFSGTVIALTVATPLLVIFSPVLVPAVITVFLLAAGFLASGGFAITASIVFTWMYKYMKDELSFGSNLLERVSHNLGSKAQGMSDQRGEHTTGDSRYATGKVDYSTGGDNYGAGKLDYSTGGDNYGAGKLNYSTGGDNYTKESEGVIQKLAIAATATTVGGPLIFLAGLVLARMIGELAMDIPLILIFTPVLVPAVITILSTTGGFGLAAKAGAATTVGATFLILSGWIFSRSVFEVVTVTPLLVIFSPVFVPVVITVFLLATGFLASGGFAVAAVTVLTWLYKYVTGGHPTGVDSVDHGIHDIDDSDRHGTYIR